MISRYPDGAAGGALLLMRLSYALVAWPALARLWPASATWWPGAMLAAIIALALIAGLGTRVAALLLVLALAADLFSASGEVALLLLGCAGGGAALAMLGPGAHSIDAHRFGRRVIRVEPRSLDRGGGR